MRHLIDIIKKLLLLVLLIVFVVDLQAQETVSLNGQWLMGEGRCNGNYGGYPIMLDVDVPLKKGETKDVALFGSLSLRFRQATEPETHFFPDVQDSTLFAHLPHDYRGMWNGMRGQLVMPAREVELIGVNADIFLDQWEARGADRQLIESGSPYYAYEKYGYYKFSTRPNDSEAEQVLLTYVDQVMLDAPSLAIFVNPKEKVKQTDVAASHLPPLRLRRSMLPVMTRPPYRWC